MRHGYDSFEKQLVSWEGSNPSRVTVILVLDKAVSAGVVHKLTNMILKHGFTCSYAGAPAMEK